MSDVGRQICRLCLEVVPVGNCAPISEIDKETLKVLLINIDFDISDNVACKRCTQKLQDCFEFKSTCFYVDDYITPFVYTDFRVDIKKVFQKVMTKEKVDLENSKICRLCMTLIENNAFMYNTDLKDGVSLKNIIANCLPEVNLNTVHEPAICELCLRSAEKLNDFMKTCQKVEQSIKNYYKVAQGHGNPGRISLEDLLKFNNSRTLSTPTTIEKDHLDAENALMWPKYEDTVSIKCEEIHIKNETENDVQMDDFGELRNCNTSADRRSSKGATKIRTSASKGKKHVCPKCPYSSKITTHVKKHMLTHSDNEVYGCNLCSFITNIRLSWRAHIASHRGRTKRYGCPKCTFETQKKFVVDQHYLTHKDNSEVQMYKCPLCPHKTKYKRSLMTHQQTHEDPEVVNKLECGKCLYKTKWRSKLDRHILLIHSTEYLYSCDRCTYRAKTDSTLREHMIKAHTDPSKVQCLKCHHCPYETAIKRYLLRHIKRWHSIEQRPELKCELCPYVTTERPYMRKHSFVHQEATLQCYHCGFRTKQKRNLQCHIKLYHTRGQGKSEPASAEAYEAGGGYDIPLPNIPQVLEEEEEGK